MERFIRKFKPVGGAALGLRTIEALSDIWTCGHKRFSCMYQGQCVVQNLDAFVARAIVSGDSMLASKIVEIAGALGNNRDEVRCQVAACADRSGNQDLARLSALTTQAVQRAAELAGMERVNPNNMIRDDATRAYVDDSRSLIPHLFVPMRDGVAPEIVDSLAIGPVLYLFYDTLNADTLVFQRDPRALATTNHYLAWAPNAPRYGTPETAMWIAFFDYSLRALFDQTDLKTIITRNVEADLNFIRGQATRRGARLYFQRFGVEGQGIGPVEDMYNRSVAERPIAITYLEQARTWETLFFPSLLFRGWIAGVYTEREMAQWFNSHETCQTCYAASQTSYARVLAMDVRTEEETGAMAMRSLRPLRHGGEDLAGIRSRDLNDGEVLTRQGDHWCATVCRSTTEAVYVTATFIHRLMRGRGLSDGFQRLISAEAVAWCYLQWLPDRADCIVLFRLLAYAQQLYTPPFLSRLGAWTDLAVFFREIYNQTDASEAVLRDIHGAMLALVRFHVHNSAQHGFTRPCAPPPQIRRTPRR
ncbi:NS1 [Great Island virus]|uniref:Non-structural protein NS1 n=1 Tax=Great Island virus TaxID=204269 RepID=E1AA92_9REOV|nr:NS1 [Great Island virus]ADM88595.1 NS1 [Great Island virus]